MRLNLILCMIFISIFIISFRINEDIFKKDFNNEMDDEEIKIFGFTIGFGMLGICIFLNEVSDWIYNYKRLIGE